MKFIVIILLNIIVNSMPTFADDFVIGEVEVGSGRVIRSVSNTSETSAEVYVQNSVINDAPESSKVAAKKTIKETPQENDEASDGTENLLVLERHEDGTFVLTYYYGSNTSFRLTRTAGGADKVYQPFVSGELGAPTFLPGNAVSWVLQEKLTENNPIRMFRVEIK
jgi:hypothetical protein